MKEDKYKNETFRILANNKFQHSTPNTQAPIENLSGYTS